MQRLSGTDSLFLAGETRAWHQHVAGLAVVDPTGVPGFGYDAIRKTVEERLPLVPKFMWKLRELPLRIDRPVWVDDPDFDIDRHMFRATVDPPGGPREVAAVVGEILSQQLDRSLPLWQLWYLDGIVNGRAAIVMKYHHCLLDGVAGTGLATLLLDVEPEPEPRDLPIRPDPEMEPSTLRLVVHTLPSLALLPVRAAGYTLRLARRGVDLGRYALSSRPKPDLGAMRNTPKTSFNDSIGPERTMAYSSVSLADAKALRTHFGVKINDIVLAVCSGALRRYLVERGELPEHSLTAGVPVSLRAGDDTSLDNQVSFVVVPLATDIADPADRIRAIGTSTMAAKEFQGVLREHPVGSIGEAAPPFLIGGVLRAAYVSHLLSYFPGMLNTLISNVAGPPIPLYMAGAHLCGIFPTSVILEGMGLNITVFTFEDRVDFGLHVDPNLVPDPWQLSAAIPVALAELMDAAGLGAPTPVADAFGVVEQTA
ncbi:MAG TPA: wax ester/triacylglycerol synthase family O-acyltransferase [Acidimicrobiia bacterium]|nr:wax ester/triacylglycerol synthase family O-acyltransferase [Acidimicrobiia bacterium]